MRWIGYGWAIRQRHQLLSVEMFLRGYTEKTPVRLRSNKNCWPDNYIDDPHIQFALLEKKYAGKEKGRIPLPKTAQQLWSHHKYSVLARDILRYKMIGKEVSKMSPSHDFSGLSDQLVLILRERPSCGGICNSLQHMWGHVSSSYPGKKHHVQNWSPKRLLKEIQKLVMSTKEAYLISSTAISELEIWV